MRDGLLEGKVVLVTGGASGIGLDCALAYHREGALVAIADVDAASAREAAERIGSQTTALECDVSDGGAVERTVAAVLQRYGRLDAVHNNAGVALPAKPLHTTTEQEWNRLFEVNVKALYWLTRFAIDALAATRGTILSTASIVGLIGQSSHAAYVGTKGALISLTKAMALDYAAQGIRVNAICPAGIWTPMLENWCSAQPDPDAVRRQMDYIHALAYCPKGDVVADAAVFLLSDRARFITGCILPVSGGAELGYRR